MVAARDTKVNKTAFITEHLGKDPTANAKSVNEAWSEAGHSGAISTTLVSMTRRELGLAGNRRGRPRGGAEGSNGSARGKSARAKSGAKALGRPRSVGRPAAPAPAAGASAPRGRTLDAVEAGIDDLIFALKGLGEFAEVEAALRTARRLLARSHGG